MRTEEQKAAQRRKNKSIAGRQRRAKYNASAKGKAAQRRRNQKRVALSPERKAWRAAYMRTAVQRERRAKYARTWRRSQSGAASRVRYEGSLKGKESRERKQSSEAKKAANRRHDAAKRGAHGKHSTAEWKALAESYHGMCVYCGNLATVQDHVTALKRGGSDDISNVVPCCGRCNSSKRDTPLMVWLARRKAA